MKNSLVLLVICLVFAACKYEDGPKVSLRTKKHRAVNTWYLDKVLENSTDKTTEYKNVFVNYSIELKKDNSYALKYRPLNLSDYLETGHWEFSGDKESINFTPDGAKSPSNWKILRLTEKETWVIQKLNGVDVELRMKD